MVDVDGWERSAVTVMVQVAVMGRIKTASRTVSLAIKRWMPEVMMLVVGMVVQTVGYRIHWLKLV